MHLVQLLLQKFNLLLDGGLAVNLLTGILLCSLRFLTDTENLHQLIDCLLHQLQTLFPGIRLKNMVLFLPGKAHIASQSADCFRITLPVIDHAAHPDAPLKTFGKIHQFFLDGIEFLLLLFWRNILNVRQIHCFRLHRAICIFYG